jgi:hypothetical protein
MGARPFLGLGVDLDQRGVDVEDDRGLVWTLP